MYNSNQFKLIITGIHETNRMLKECILISIFQTEIEIEFWNTSVVDPGFLEGGGEGHQRSTR